MEESEAAQIHQQTLFQLRAPDDMKEEQEAIPERTAGSLEADLGFQTEDQDVETEEEESEVPWKPRHSSGYPSCNLTQSCQVHGLGLPQQTRAEGSTVETNCSDLPVRAVLGHGRPTSAQTEPSEQLIGETICSNRRVRPLVGQPSPGTAWTGLSFGGGGDDLAGRIQSFMDDLLNLPPASHL
ncbi:hypothetical protein PSTT_05556 [Puccinia striiformis]|uniref:Uncharacterized protein n=1 Tax=Puccinia striiformis TaxID=27350 RepID=A0A2S4VNC6_9BASI|nr:hypothetical protein PSTT_05556 [Puccinia striiformis]